MTYEKVEDERKALRLVQEALALPSARRLKFIERAAGDDVFLRRVMEIMSANADAIPVLAPGAAIELHLDIEMPAWIGDYRIEREIGRGGMGAVYLGKKSTDDYEHVAAIKVVRSDAASPRLIERLRAERRTLARLKHPNIAQMYDGGETEDGSPYFVMEYVGGAPLSIYIAEHAPTLEERLRIFLDACAAVAYAHRNLIIHRDLSPANMLVSEDGHVKLIDFGISRSADADGDAGEIGGAQLTMTKGYSAPERLDGAPASTVTDIYSLGVILGDLIDGIEAPRRGDIAAIAAKAASRDPETRYRTVDALVEDVIAYQRGQAVAAVGGGWRYQLSRFVGRRKLAVGAGASAVLAGIGAIIVMSALYVRAEAARNAALEQTARAEAAERQATQRFGEVRELAGFMMFDLYDEITRLEGSTAAREKLAARALDYLDRLNATADAPTDLKLEIARGYKRLADVVGNPANANLGARTEAGALLAKAAAQISTLDADALDNAEALRAFVEIKFAEANFEGFSNNDFERGLTLMQEAQEASAALIARDDALLTDRLTDADIEVMRGYHLESLGKYSDAEVRINAGLSKYEALAAAQPDDVDVSFALARANGLLGEAVSWRIAFEIGERIGGDYSSALPYFDRGINLSRRLLDDPRVTFQMKTHHVVILAKRANTTCYFPGHEREGIADLDEAGALAESLLAGDPGNRRVYEMLTNIVIQKADCYHYLGQPADAARAAEAAVSRREALLENEPDNPGLLQDLANTLTVVARHYIEANDWRNACVVLKKNDEVWRRYGEHQTALDHLDRKEQQDIQEILADCAKRGFK